MADASHDRPSKAPATPRWVRALGAGIFVAVVVVVVVMVTAGGEHGPGIHAAPDGAPPPAQDPSLTGDEGAVGGPPRADQAARTIAIQTLDTLTFEPAGIDISAGETVTFVVSNSGQAVHEFTLGDAAMQDEHAAARAHLPAGAAHELPNSITLQPGETKRLTWRFGAAGSLEYACHEPGHYDGGMRGRITVS